MSSLFEQAVNHDVIDASTVHQVEIYDSGSKFVMRFFGETLDLVEKRAERAVQDIDYMRAPSAGLPYKFGPYHAVDVTYYGLD